MTSIRNALHAIDNFGAISCFQTLDYLCSQTEKHQLCKTNIYIYIYIYIYIIYIYIWGFPRGSVVKNPLAMQETWVQFLGQEDPLEKEMATHSSSLGWEIPWTEEPDGLQSMGSQNSWI